MTDVLVVLAALVVATAGAVAFAKWNRARRRRDKVVFRQVLDEVSAEISEFADEIESVPRRAGGIVAEQRRRATAAYTEASRLLAKARSPRELSEACALIREERQRLRSVREGA
ncbi:hypothetical protein [Actinokineospora iranica]|uniref:Uncharacterized protein n=1 Tax=Actinokineospora iranica TaxID=1271860 RepID=A0A1G6YRR8_9PSEU|nr:hypothetical protein [Actinokineospora iranica]SDD93194.1 hypothetical protein SAMN05216174_12320 [Actinokineospora iranica]